MSDGDFPFRSFTLRPEGYDRNEVDDYTAELRSEIIELRRNADAAGSTGRGDHDTRLHDPEGAVTRTLAIAQETADRVLHDAQVEADRRRSEADEHSSTTMAEADSRATKMLADIEVQAAEVREQGIAAARSAIKVERDKAMSELAQVRRVRNDLRAEAVDLKAALDKYRSQAREASDTLAAASSGPLMTIDLPDFVDDELALTAFTPVDSQADEPRPHAVADDDDLADDYDMADDDAQADDDYLADDAAEDDAADHDEGGGTHLRAVDDDADNHAETVLVAVDDDDSADGDDEPLADVLEFDGDGDDDEYDDDEGDDDDGGSGAFLAEVTAAADEPIGLIPEDEAGDTDRFLSELRGVADLDIDLDSDAADRFFED